MPDFLELMTDPVTGEDDKQSSPNTTSRKLIQQFCTDVGVCASSSGGQSRDIAIDFSPECAAAEEMKFLSRFLARRLVFGSSEQKTKAAYEIRHDLTSHKPSIFFFEHHAQEIAISALLKLSKHTSADSRSSSEGLSLEAKQMAAAIIFYLASVKPYRKLIGETPENDELIADSLASCSHSRELMDISNPANFGFIYNPRILRSSHPDCQEYSVTVLLSLCKNGGQKRFDLAKDHSLMSSLYLLLTDGSSYGSSKARALMKLLHKFHETSSSGRIASVVPCERPVHVW
uniref:U-box domain-containing protein n=1 Tax=Salix viminalis TaxID=40686 RepID=A0A6N2LIM9_SALVM